MKQELDLSASVYMSRGVECNVLIDYLVYTKTGEINGDEEGFNHIGDIIQFWLTGIQPEPGAKSQF